MHLGSTLCMELDICSLSLLSTCRCDGVAGQGRYRGIPQARQPGGGALVRLHKGLPGAKMRSVAACVLGAMSTAGLAVARCAADAFACTNNSCHCRRNASVSCRQPGVTQL